MNRLLLTFFGLATSCIVYSNNIDHPLIFEQNQGQFNSKIEFLSRGKGYNIILGEKTVIELFKYKQIFSNNDIYQNIGENELKLTSYVNIQLQILGANQSANIVAENKVETKTNYIVGSEINWKTDIPNYSHIRYEEILKNIDVVYYGNNGRLEYDFILKPHADTKDILLSFGGADNLEVNQKGQLIIGLGKNEIIQKKPIAYQINAKGIKHFIDVSYKITNDQVGFKIGKYDSSKELIIDPVLEYARYYGGSKNEYVVALDVDSSDNIYMIGHSASPNLATSGAFQEINKSPLRKEIATYSICPDCTDQPIVGSQVERFHILPPSTSSVFVTKFSADGSTVLWNTYFSHPDAKPLSLGVNSAAVSSNGEVAFGITSEAPDGLPLVNPTQIFSNTQSNVYIAKLNSSGNGLVFSTYLSVGTDAVGIGGGWIRGLDVANDGSVSAVGFVSDVSDAIANIDFPEINPLSNQSCKLDGSKQDFFDGWVIFFNSSGSAIFSSCLGGSMRRGSFLEALRGVTIGTNGHIYALGYTSMIDFPVVNPVQATLSFPGNTDTTVTEIDPNNSEIVFSTYLGPTVNGFASSPTSDEISGGNFPINIKVDLLGNIIVTGSTNLTGWPTVNAFQPNLNVVKDINKFNLFGDNIKSLNYDSYITKIDPINSNIIFSTYLGGSNFDGYWNSLSLDSNGNSYILTTTDSDDYPVNNSIQVLKFGRSSAVVSKFSPQGNLIFSSFHGGTDDFKGKNFYPGGIIINAANKIIVATNTQANDFNAVNSSTTNSGKFDATLSIIDQSTDVDTDGDGVVNGEDDFPFDVTEWLDTDSDNVGNNADTDDDNDMILDVNDVFPLDPNEFEDTDKDGVGDNADKFPYDALNIFDNNLNGEGDYTEYDADNDGIYNQADFRPFDFLEWFDTDGDKIGNNADMDDDNDGLDDINDIAPLDANNPVITFNGFNSQNMSVNKSPLPDGFTHLSGTDVVWSSAQDQSFNAGTSMSTISPSDNQVAGMQYDGVFEAGTISFQYKVDSEKDFDFFTFSLDGQTLLIDSGQVDWKVFTTPVTAGNHTLIWKYIKNGTISVGTDAAWIDDLQGFPQVNTDLIVKVISESIQDFPGFPSDVSYTIAVENNSAIALTAVNFQSTLITTVLTDVTWYCDFPHLSSKGTTCDSNYNITTKKSNSDATASKFATININKDIDIAPYEQITFVISGKLDEKLHLGSINYSAFANVENSIREDDTSNNTINGSIFIGFADSFED